MIITLILVWTIGIPVTVVAGAWLAAIFREKAAGSREPQPVDVRDWLAAIYGEQTVGSRDLRPAGTLRVATRRRVRRGWSLSPSGGHPSRWR
jgi:hypothetical protein